MIGGLLTHLLRFPQQRGKGPEITREIMTTFRSGFARGVRLEAPTRYREALESQPWHQRSFFCEGHAMGRAARWSFGGRPNREYDGDPFTAARCIGYGFWNGVASRYPVPSLTIDDAPLLVDGASYGRILSRRRLDASEMARMRGIANAEDREAALHGAGRVLWLLYMYNFDALRANLEVCGRERDAVALGIGFAIGFIHARDAWEIPAMLAEFGPAVTRGAGVALALHTVHDAESCRAVTSQLRGELLKTVEAARRNAPAYWGLKNRR